MKTIRYIIMILCVIIIGLTVTCLTNPSLIYQIDDIIHTSNKDSNKEEVVEKEEKEDTTQVKEETVSEVDSGIDPTLYQQDIDDLDHLKLSVKSISIVKESKDRIRILDVNENQVAYACGNESIKIYNIDTNQTTTVEGISPSDNDEGLIYNNQILYKSDDSSSLMQRLSYGSTKLVDPPDWYTRTNIYHADKLYVVVNIWGPNDRTIYEFNGTLNVVWKSSSGCIGETELINNMDHQFAFINNEGLEDVYYQQNGQLLRHRFEVQNIDSKPEIMGDYILYGRVLYNKTTDQQTTLNAYYLKDGKITDQTNTFNAYMMKVMGVGNHMFLFTSKNSNVLYKAIIDESNGIILYTDTDESVYKANSCYYGDDNTILAYSTQLSYYNVTEDKKMCIFKIEYEFE